MLTKSEVGRFVFYYRVRCHGESMMDGMRLSIRANSRDEADAIAKKEAEMMVGRAVFLKAV